MSQPRPHRDPEQADDGDRLEVQGERIGGERTRPEQAEPEPARRPRQKLIGADGGEPEHQAVEGVEAGELAQQDAVRPQAEEQGGDPGREAAGDVARPQEDQHHRRRTGQHRGQPGDLNAFAEQGKAGRDQHREQRRPVVHAFGNPELALRQPVPRGEQMVELIEPSDVIEVRKPGRQSNDTQDDRRQP